MPKVDADLMDLSLSFDARAWSSNFKGTIYVGTMADPDDPNTFSLIASYPQNDPDAFGHYTLTLADYDLPYDNLVFTSGFYASMGLTASSDVYLDNVALERVDRNVLHRCRNHADTDIGNGQFMADCRITGIRSGSHRRHHAISRDRTEDHVGFDAYRADRSATGYFVLRLCTYDL